MRIVCRYSLDGQSVDEAIRTIRHVEPAEFRIRAARADDIRAVIGKALAKEVTQRYATAGDFAADLHRLLSAQPVTARPSRFGLGSILRWMMREERVVQAGIGTLLASASAFLFHLYFALWGLLTLLGLFSPGPGGAVFTAHMAAWATAFASMAWLGWAVAKRRVVALYMAPAVSFGFVVFAVIVQFNVYRIHRWREYGPATTRAALFPLHAFRDHHFFDELPGSSQFQTPAVVEETSGDTPRRMS